MIKEKISGNTDEDNIIEARNRFATRRETLNANAWHRYEEAKKTNPDKKKPKKLAEEFTFMHCYDVLKDTHVLASELTNKANQRRKRKASSSPPDASGLVTPESQAHPGFFTSVDPENAFNENDLTDDEDGMSSIEDLSADEEENENDVNNRDGEGDEAAVASGGVPPESPAPGGNGGRVLKSKTKAKGPKKNVSKTPSKDEKCSYMMVVVASFVNILVMYLSTYYIIVSCTAASGKKKAKLMESLANREVSMASSQRAMADSSRQKVAVLKQHVSLTEQEVSLRKKEVALKEKELELKRRELEVITTQSNISTISVSEEGLTDLGKQMLRMQQQILLQQMQRQLMDNNAGNDQ